MTVNELIFNFRINVESGGVFIIEKDTGSFLKVTKAMLDRIGHEYGHILFTDFNVAKRFQQAILNGKFYPKKPAAKDFSSKTYKNNLAEILKVFDEQNPVKLKVVSKIVLYLSNVVEDGYIERLMKAKFPGSISIGIQLNNIRQAEIMPSLKDMIDQK